MCQVSRLAIRVGPFCPCIVAGIAIVGGEDHPPKFVRDHQHTANEAHVDQSDVYIYQ